MDRVKPVILINTFGSTLPEGLAELENVDRMVTARYPGYEVRWGFGGQVSRASLIKSGRTTVLPRRVPVLSPLEVYNSLRKETKHQVAAVYLYISPGSVEIFPLMTPADTAGLNVEHGYPLLAPPDNTTRVADAIASRFGGEDTVNIVCNLGSIDVPTLNLPLLQIDSYLRKHYRRAFLATVNGPPGTEAAFSDARKLGLKKVKFHPLVLGSGRRLLDAIIGDNPSSLKNQLGLEASCEHGLGDNTKVVDIWMESIDWTLAKFIG